MGEQIKVHVLRSVPVSDDGITARHIVAGTEDEVPAGLYIGLLREGYVRAPDGAHAIRAAEPEAPVAPPPKPSADDDLEVKHVGRGKWFIVRGEERVQGPFDGRDEAEAALKTGAVA